MEFKTWLNTFVAEKGLDREHVFTVETDHNLHFVEFKALIEAFCNTIPSEQESIKSKIVEIDFHNGDVMHFFNHLAKAYAEMYDSK